MKSRLIFIAALLLSATAVMAQPKVRTGVQAGYGILPASACQGTFKQTAFVETALSRDELHSFEYTIALGYIWGAPPQNFGGIPSQVASDMAGEMLVGARYLWMDRKATLYSAVALGAELRWQSGGRGSLLTPGAAYHVTVLGVRTGHRRLVISGELGVGHLGTLRFGVGYKF